jgi:hypothetical protein
VIADEPDGFEHRVRRLLGAAAAGERRQVQSLLDTIRR